MGFGHWPLDQGLYNTHIANIYALAFMRQILKYSTRGNSGGPNFHLAEGPKSAPVFDDDRVMVKYLVVEGAEGRGCLELV